MRKLSLLLVFLSAIAFKHTNAQTCTANITAGGPTTFCQGGNVQLSANTGGNTWVRKADFGGVARQGAASFSIGSKGYIGTGQDAAGNKTTDFWAYDPSANTWTQVADFGGTARINATGFAVGSKGYVGTGFDVANKKDFWEYDPSSNAWTQKANFGGAIRAGATGFAIGAKGYIGTGKSGTRKNDFWEYDPSSNTWTQKAAFGGTERDGATSFSIGNKGYIGMGFDITSNIKNDFWEYDQASNTWTQKADFTGPSRQQAVGFSIAGRGYAAVGINGNVRRNDLWEYNPATNNWMQKANYGGTVRRYASAFVIDGKAYLGMGQDQKGVLKKDIWQYEPSYTHLWSTGATTSSIIVNTSDSYTVTVMTSSGCSATSSPVVVTVKPLAGISGASAAVSAVCAGSTTYLVADGVTGTNAVVNWWTGPGSTGTHLGTGDTLFDVPAGTYYAVVTADCGTPQEASVTVGQNIDAGIVSATPGASPICASSTTSLSANGVTGTNAMVNWWTGPGGTGSNIGSGEMLNNVAPGTYYARVTGDCGAPAEASVTIDTILVTRGDTTAAICNSFTWHDSTYKVSGDYTYNSTGAQGCDSITTLHLTILSVSSTYSKLDAACFRDSSGSLIITPTSGVGPYTYRIGTVGSYVPDSTFTNLRAGNYRVSILDAEGCAGISDQVIIGETPAIASTYTSEDATCAGTATGSLIITPTSGVPPYMYKLGTAGSFGSSNSFSNLKAGNYKVYIQDANGCTGKTSAIRINQPLPITGTFNTTEPSCYGAATASLIVTPTNGTAPYQYKLGTTGSFGSSNSFTNIKAGNLRVYIQDGTGCVGTNSVTISQPTAVKETLSKMDASCNGAMDGSITANGSGGNPPYEYKLGTAGTFGNDNVFTNLKAGSYRVYIKDANGCDGTSVSISVGQPATPCSKTIPVKYSRPANDITSTIFEVKLTPNPAIDRFTMHVQTVANQPVYVKVFDVNGKTIYHTKTLPGQALNFGEQFTAGIYMIEVRQGDEIKRIKAVKVK